MIDEKKIEAGIRLLLEGIGEDLERPGLKDTPHRIANMYKEIYGGWGLMHRSIWARLSRPSIMSLFWKRTLLFIRLANIIYCLFMGRHISPIYRMIRS